MTTNVLIVQGSVRAATPQGPASMGMVHGTTTFVQSRVNAVVSERGLKPSQVDITTVEPVTHYGLPNIHTAPPKVLQGNYQNEAVKKWSEAVKAADAIFIVTPEYNGMVTPTLALAIDSLFPEWEHKKIGLVGYGPYGAGRATKILQDNVLPTIQADLVQSTNITFAFSHVIGNSLTPDNATEILSAFQEPVDQLIKAVLDKAVKA